MNAVLCWERCGAGCRLVQLESRVWPVAFPHQCRILSCRVKKISRASLNAGYLCCWDHSNVCHKGQNAAKAERYQEHHWIWTTSVVGTTAMWHFRTAHTAPIITYYIVYPGNTPENHPLTEACMINSKQHGVQNSGPRDPWQALEEKKNTGVPAGAVGCRNQEPGTCGYRW